MSLKSELLIYTAALEAYDTSQYSVALAQFSRIGETSKVQWNMGIILATMGRHGEAIARFGESVGMDKYLVVGWYQRGVSYFLVGMYEKAVKDFEMAFLYMRGNKTINYTQLGLAHILYSCEILFNLGLAKIYLGQTASGMIDLRQAQEEKMIPEHGVIDDAIRDHGRGYHPFTVPAGLLFRPSESKMKNIKTRDYMGKAILVSASDPNDAYTTFTGITRLQRGQTPKGVALDPSHPLSRSLTQLQAKSNSLARSASISDIPGPDSNLPIANRMARTKSPLPSPGLGLTRSLTISNPDPSSPRSPMGHARSNTVDSPSASISSANGPTGIGPILGGDGRPTRPRIVIPSSDGLAFHPRDQSDRYPAFPLDHNQNHRDQDRLRPPPTYPIAKMSNPENRSPQDISQRQRQPLPPLITSHHQHMRPPARYQASPAPLVVSDREILQTPQDRFEGLEDIYDNYHTTTPTPDLTPDLDTGVEMPYTAIGQAFTTGLSSPLPLPLVNKVSQVRRMPSRSNLGLGRSNTASSNSNSGRYQAQAQGQGQGGLLLTVEDGTLQSPGGANELTKIRIKVHVGKHTRGMSILPDDTYHHLVHLLRQKFPELHGKGKGEGGVNVSFRDEDGDMLSMQDDGDFEAAVDVARVLSNGRAEGRLEIWVD